MQNRIITTYDDYLEKAKDSKENKENQFEAPIRTEDSERKTFSFKSGRRSNSAQVRSRAASRYRDCSPDPKTKEFNTSSSCILNRRGSKDAVICNFQKRMDFEKENEKSPTKSPMRTPKLGTLNSTSSFPCIFWIVFKRLSFVVGTRESSQTVLRERKNFSNQEEYAKDPIKELKMVWFGEYCGFLMSYVDARGSDERKRSTENKNNEGKMNLLWVGLLIKNSWKRR